MSERSKIMTFALKQGPTFGAMMISGQKAAHLALKSLGIKENKIRPAHLN